MANYSKEAERQNKALKDLMSGKTYEKDYVQVGYEGKVDNLSKPLPCNSFSLRSTCFKPAKPFIALSVVIGF